MTHNLPTCRLLCIDVPEGAFTFQLYGATSADELRFLTSPSPGKFKQHKTLIPPGNWSLLGRFEDVTEETWSTIMERYVYSGRTSYYAYKDYSGENPESEDDILTTATASARSLIAGNPVVLIERK